MPDNAVITEEQRIRIGRLARKTICFSKSILMRDIVIGLFVNRYEFGLSV
jgi:insertion element IS1 protein InsB